VLDDPAYRHVFSTPVHALAAGKAAGAMAAALATHSRVPPRHVLAIGTHRHSVVPEPIEWVEAAHPYSDARSEAAAGRALAMAAAVEPHEWLVLLLSGGASALMAAPIDGVTLAEKQRIVQRMMLSGADIHALNTVRKHLSRVKGGRLAAACRGATLTLAISDVVGDDVSVIGSGPGVADATTVADARECLRRFAPDYLDVPLRETPKPDDPALERTATAVIASRRHALASAAEAARAHGYHVVTVEHEITGEARAVAEEWFSRASAAARAVARPVCVLSAGETTVRVTGRGRGGRNQEFALALVERLARADDAVVVASIGTDGIDGPTDAAGALVDRTSRARARELGLDPRAFLADNNAYEFFANLGDLVHLGRTETNVGDVQVLLQT
jgi:glycerate 2-kinase